MKNCFLLLLLVIFISSSAAQTIQLKKTIAVINLKNAADVTKGEVDIISDRLRIELFKTGNVDVMEREQMQTILKEQGFQASGACSDEGCMVEMGQLLGVQSLVTGSIGKLGTLYLLNFRVIDVQTAKIDKVVSIDIGGGIEEVVSQLSDIAWQLTSSVSRKRKPQPMTIVVDNVKDYDPITPPECDGSVFLESINFKSNLTFSLDEETIDEINSDIKDAIEEAIQEEIDDDIDVEVLTPAQIAQLPPDCKSGIVRVTLDAYSTRSSGTQFVGKATSSFYFYSTPRPQKPVFKITITEEGDRHWGDQTPIINAFEEIADELEDELEDSDYIYCLDPEKK